MNGRVLTKVLSKMCADVFGDTNPQPDAGPFTGIKQQVEVRMHELAHHVVLENGWDPKPRLMGINRTLDNLPFAIYWAHEIDTLAVECLTFGLLGYRINYDKIIDDAVANGNVVTARELTRTMVYASMENGPTNDLAKDLHEAIELELYRMKGTA